MLEVPSSNPPVVTGINDSSKSRARHHRSFKLDSKFNYLNDKENNFGLTKCWSEKYFCARLGLFLFVFQKFLAISLG